MRPCKIFSVCLVVLTCLPSLISGGPLRRLVANGKNSDVEEFPFVVALVYSDIHPEYRVYDPAWRNSLRAHCTGTLVRDNIVILAAHCFGETAGANNPVRGAWILADTPRVPAVDGDLLWGSVHEVYSVIQNPEYARRTNLNYYDHDVAILLLSTPVPALTPSGKYRTYPKLPSEELVKLCTPVTHIGYGLNTPELYLVDFRLEPVTAMSQMTGTVIKLHSVVGGPVSTYSVAADPETGAMLVVRDSGGPVLARDSRGAWMLVGVNSAVNYDMSHSIVTAIFHQRSFVTHTLFKFWKMSVQMKLQNFFAKMSFSPSKWVGGNVKSITGKKVQTHSAIPEKKDESMRTDNLDITEVEQKVLGDAFGLPAPSGFNHSSVVEAKAALTKGYTWSSVHSYVQRCALLVAGFLDLTHEQRLGSGFTPDIKSDLVDCAYSLRRMDTFVSKFNLWFKHREFDPALAACPRGAFYEDSHIVVPPYLWDLPHCPVLPVVQSAGN